MLHISNQFGLYIFISISLLIKRQKYALYILRLLLEMANVNNIISFLFSLCTKLCTCGVMENVNLNTEMHCHFEYCIYILHITLQIEICYTYASIQVKQWQMNVKLI